MRISDWSSDVCSSDLEVDLFGANRRALEGASTRLQATQAEAQGVRMRIAAEVARTWFEATGAGEELRAQRAAVATFQQTLELTRSRAALGDVSGADVAAAHAQWAADPKSVVKGQRVSVRDDLGGRGIPKNNKKNNTTT